MILLKEHEQHTDVFAVSILTGELPKSTQEFTKWSSCTPGDSTHMRWEPFCNLQKCEYEDRIDLQLRCISDLNSEIP